MDTPGRYAESAAARLALAEGASTDADRTQHIAAAQVWATLALAAATEAS